MQLKNILPKDHVLLALDGDRDCILRSLSQPLVKNKTIVDLDRFLQDISRRECQITTQVTPVVALPHARSNAARRLGLTVGICKNGIRFTEGTEPLCRLLFMIAIPAFAPTAHLPLLQTLADFVHNEDRVQKLLEATSPAKAANQIIRFSAH